MKWLGLSIIALVLTVASIFGVGSLLPESHVASRTRYYTKTPDQIWNVITNVEEFAAWRPGLQSAERLPPVDGRVRWREKTKYDAMTMEVMQSVQAQKLVTRIADQGLPFSGTWTFELKPVTGGTDLTITEQGEINNPIFRFIARFVIGYTSTMDKYHEGLGRRLQRSQ
jgi:uncharacterized protein YndB with AHSA1/START domain